MRVGIAVLLAWFCFAGSALAEKRLALVIGNDSYRHIDRLQKARADAKSYADLLREKGFSVEDRYDLGFDEMGRGRRIRREDRARRHRGVRLFRSRLERRRAQLSRRRRRAGAPSEERLTRLSLPIRNGATGVLDDFERKGAALKVAIIDACRDNPFQPPPGRRGYGLPRGLRPEGVEGSFVVYSAGEGQSAMDRLSEADADPNSVFTRAFLPLLRQDLPLLDAVKAPRARLRARPHRRSRPDAGLLRRGARTRVPLATVQGGERAGGGVGVRRSLCGDHRRADESRDAPRDDRQASRGGFEGAGEEEVGGASRVAGREIYPWRLPFPRRRKRLRREAINYPRARNSFRRSIIFPWSIPSKFSPDGARIASGSCG